VKPLEALGRAVRERRGAVALAGGSSSVCAECNVSQYSTTSSVERLIIALSLPCAAMQRP
jgi:hypothetical protein